MMQNKGQSSFEMLIGAVVIIALAVFILNNYLTLSDSTIALSIMKVETIKELNKQPELITLDKITFTEKLAEKEITFDIILNPAVDPPVALDLSQAVTIIQDKTKYENVEIKINGIVIPTP
ncbi:MAG: hypothetical protein Q7S21_07890 [archaeon]|nr:hypothetical protein [archaeon]